MTDTHRRIQTTGRPFQPSESAMAGYDIDAAVEVTRELHNSGLLPASLSEVVPLIVEKPHVSTFRTKVYSAAKYGFVETRVGRTSGVSEVAVLPLGERVIDPEHEREAKVRGFLNVPLNKRIYQYYRGRPLPPDHELELFMREELGVTPGQVKNGRQVMMRSARQAGFFDRGRDWLIIPSDVTIPDDELNLVEQVTQPALPASNGNGPVTPVPSSTRVAENLQPPVVTTARANASTVDADVATWLQAMDPAVFAWLRKIPTDSSWPKHKRERWRQMLGSLLDYVFDDGDIDDESHAP